MEIMAMFDRDGDIVTVISWIKEGIKWQVGDVAEPAIIDALRSRISWSPTIFFVICIFGTFSGW